MASVCWADRAVRPVDADGPDVLEQLADGEELVGDAERRAVRLLLQEGILAPGPEIGRLAHGFHTADKDKALDIGVSRGLGQEHRSFKIYALIIRGLGPLVGNTSQMKDQIQPTQFVGPGNTLGKI